MTPGVIVIGAGPAGIGAALSLGDDAVVLEHASEVAGLAQTVTRDGVLFDLGGHSFHTPHQVVRDLVFGALDMEEQVREAWCRFGDEWIAYPFQKNVASLSDAALRKACLDGMATAGGGSGAAHFDAFLEARFGKPVADLFMRPYNRKLWGIDLSLLATDWTGERVAAPVGVAERFSHESGQRKPLQADTRIAYPARGGFGEIFRALARRIGDLRLGTGVTRIDPAARTLTTTGGQTLAFERIVSTLPLPDLLGLLPDVPPPIAAAVARLRAVPLDLVLVVLEGRGPMERQRVYSHEPTVPGHKIVMNHTSSRWLRDQPRHGIQVEVSAGHGHADPAQLAGRVVENLVRMGLIDSRAEVLRTEVLRLRRAYPIPTHERDAIVVQARDWLAGQRIHLAGRFAEWAYVNADEALKRGLDLGHALAAGGRPEP